MSDVMELMSVPSTPFPPVCDCKCKVEHLVFIPASVISWKLLSFSSHVSATCCSSVGQHQQETTLAGQFVN